MLINVMNIHYDERARVSMLLWLIAVRTSKSFTHKIPQDRDLTVRQARFSKKNAF